jgi:ACS family pantothenate transporter-like MFS transporter
MLIAQQLDRNNINNAYVSGMRDDLGFKGDQLNQIMTCFTVGYAAIYIYIYIYLLYSEYIILTLSLVTL